MSCRWLTMTLVLSCLSSLIDRCRAQHYLDLEMRYHPRRAARSFFPILIDSPTPPPQHHQGDPFRQDETWDNTDPWSDDTKHLDSFPPKTNTASPVDHPWQPTSYVEKSQSDPNRFRPLPIPLRNQIPFQRIDEFHIFHQMPNMPPRPGGPAPQMSGHTMGMGAMTNPGLGALGHPGVGAMGHPGMGMQQHPGAQGQQRPGAMSPPRPPTTLPPPRTFGEFFQRNWETTPENVYLFIGLTIWTIYLRARGEDVTFMTPIFPYLGRRRKREAVAGAALLPLGTHDTDSDRATVLADRLLLEGLHLLVDDSSCTWRAACEVPDRTRVFVATLEGAREVAHLLNMTSSSNSKVSDSLSDQLRHIADEGERESPHCGDLFPCTNSVIEQLITDLRTTPSTLEERKSNSPHF